ncbi:MAG TPA: WYL domain-containing protein [Hanamia sp.]|nr:WYL domain-containing protein [Hanamia sp.]
MPKETFLPRLSLIIKRLEKSPATYKQINDYLKDKSEDGYNYSMSVRTLQRDIRDIYKNYGIEIVNEKKGEKKYFIKSKSEMEGEVGQRLLESYQMIHIIRAAQDYKKFIFLETRKSNGTEYFGEILHAIKNKKSITFNHYKYWEDIVREKTVHPFALKESQGRWYLLAVDPGEKNLKTFGLDRISDLAISKKSFNDKYDFNIKELFLNSFGIINSENEKPQKIRLSFTYEQGQYVKNFPLHHSQKVTEEDNEVIELFIIITYDFVMELLSYGEEVTILSPKSLITQMKKIYTSALSKYS